MEQTIGSPDREAVDVGARGIETRRILNAALSIPALAWQKFRFLYWQLRSRLHDGARTSPDAERVARQLGVTRTAEQDGRRNLPPSSESAPGGMQREIIGYFTNLRRQARKRLADDAEKLKKALDRIDESELMSQVRDIPAACEHSAVRLTADFESRLKKVREQESSQKKYYEAFRETHKLDRIATYPGVASLGLVGMLLLFLAVAVALSLMAGGDAGQAAVWSAGVAAFAVVIPFLFGGPLLRALHHVSEFRNFVGAVGLGLLLAGIVATAFYADFHIAAVMADPAASYQTVIDAMLAAPLNVLVAVADWQVFSLVGLAGLVAISLAFRSDDPYPGYGAVQRAYESARSAREAVAARLRKQINRQIDDAEKDIAAIIGNFRKQVRSCARRAQRLQEDAAALANYDVELEEACNLVLERYRKVNRSARDSEAPISFGEHVCFTPDNESDSGQYIEGLPDEERLQATIAELEKEGDYARDKLRALNLQMIDSLSQPAQAAPVDRYRHRT